LPPLTHPRVRPARLLALATAATALLGATVAGPAAASPTTSFYLDVSPQGSYAEGYAPGGAPGGPYTLELVRGGTAIASQSGSFSDQTLQYAGELIAGDVLRFSSPSGSAAMTFDGTPTIGGGACVGSGSITGTVSPAASAVYAGSAIGGGSAGTNRATTSRSGTAYTAAFDGPLASGARVYASEDLTLDGGATQAYVSRSQPVADSCPASPAPPAAATPTPTPSVTVTPPALPKPSVTPPSAPAFKLVIDGRSLTPKSVEPVQLATEGFVNFTAPTFSAGTFGFLLVVAQPPKAASASAAATKRKMLTIARGTAKATTPGQVKARLKLTTAGKRLLRHAKSVRLTLTVTFTPADGGAVQKSSTSFTLRRKAEKTKKG
jgi:hypothetical protein